jgi:epoxyqueuosine reductase
LKGLITARAKALGFDAIGFTTATLKPEQREALAQYLTRNHHGSMGWMAARAAQRADPRALWPEAVSVISLGLSYAPDSDPLATLGMREAGNISVYARNRDYHDIIKGRLKHLAQFIAARQAGAKVFVDTAPVMEKPLASQAGDCAGCCRARSLRQLPGLYCRLPYGCVSGAVSARRQALHFLFDDRA